MPRPPINLGACSLSAVRSPLSPALACVYMLRQLSRRLSMSSSQSRIASRIAMIGCGKMAEALADGLQAELPGLSLCAADVNRHRALLFQERFGASVHESARDAVRGADLVLLACKPQNIAAVGKELCGHIDSETVVLSILAGTPLSVLSGSLGVARVVRSMPNTPAAVKEGMTVWMGTQSVSDADRRLVSRVLGSLGQEHEVDDEKYLDMATALSGSGPAYVLLLMESMIETGVHLGLQRDVATKLVQQTVKGTAVYAGSPEGMSAANYSALRSDITSPSGTTASAVYTLERGGFRTTVADGLWAAYRRSLELGLQDSNVGPDRSKLVGKGTDRSKP